MKKLLILDCDWVLYSPSELDVNAMVYAFNDVCDELGYQEFKFTRVEHCTNNKPVKWFYNYIRYVTDLLNIDMNEFIDKMLNTVDYSHIKRDSEWILGILEKLQSNYEICICTNNHRKHLDNVLIAKYWVNSEDFPYPCFDVTFAENDWKFYSKQSLEFVSKLEKIFNIKSSEFLWIDDTPTVLEKASVFWWKCILIDKDNSLLTTLQSL